MQGQCLFFLNFCEIGQQNMLEAGSAGSLQRGSDCGAVLETPVTTSRLACVVMFSGGITCK